MPLRDGRLRGGAGAAEARALARGAGRDDDRRARDIASVKVPLPEAVRLVLAKQRKTKAKISEIAIAPDGGGVVAITTGGAAHRIDPIKHTLTRTAKLPASHRLVGLSRGAERAVFEQLGEAGPLAASTAGAPGYVVLDLRTGAVVRRVTQPSAAKGDEQRGPVGLVPRNERLRLSLDGTRLYRRDWNALVAVDLKSGKETELGPKRDPDAPLWSSVPRGPFVILGDGKRAVLGDRVVPLEHPEGGQQFHGDFEAISPDGAWVATRQDGRFRRSPEDIRTREGHDDEVSALTFTAHNHLVSIAREALFWDGETCRSTSRRVTPGRTVAAAREKDLVFLDGAKGTVVSGKGATSSLGVEGSVRAAAFSPDGERLFLGVDLGQGQAGALLSLDPAAAAGSRVERSYGGGAPIGSIAAAPDAGMLAVLTGAWNRPDPGVLELLSPDDLSVVTQVPALGSGSVGFAGPGAVAVSEGSRGTRVLSVPGLAEKARIRSGYCCEESAVSPDGRLLAGTFRGSLFVWEIATRKLVGEVKRAHRAGVESLAFSPDSRYLASGSRDTTVLLWDVEELTVAPLPEKADSRVSGAAESRRFMDVSPMGWEPIFRVKADGTLEPGDPLRREKPPALKGVTKVTSGIGSHCAIAEGKVRCWGSTRGGALGVPEERGKDDRAKVRDKPTTLPVTDPVDVRLDDAHGCALERSGDLICWGRMGYSKPPAAPGKVLSGVKSFTLFFHQACALGNDGVARCWKESSAGPEPIPVKDVVAVGVASLHTCVLDAAGLVRCAGDNSHDQLGDDTGLDRKDFVVVSGVRDVVAIAVASAATCAATKGGSVSCWGWIGDAHVMRPTHLPALDGSTAIRIDRAAVCGLRGDHVDCVAFPAE